MTQNHTNNEVPYWERGIDVPVDESTGVERCTVSHQYEAQALVWAKVSVSKEVDRDELRDYAERICMDGLADKYSYTDGLTFLSLEPSTETGYVEVFWTTRGHLTIEEAEA